MKKINIALFILLLLITALSIENVLSEQLQIRVVVLPKMDVRNCSQNACIVTKKNIKANQINTQYYTRLLKENKLIFWF